MDGSAYDAPDEHEAVPARRDESVSRPREMLGWVVIGLGIAAMLALWVLVIVAAVLALRALM